MQKIILNIRNTRAQGLIEYLILVALMGVATIGVVRIMSHTVNAKFAQITRGLTGDSQKIETEKVRDSLYKQRDLSDFFEEVGKSSK